MIGRRLFAAPLLRHPRRVALSVLAIALGVALGVAVDAIHRSALDEFARGLHGIAGGADVQVGGPREGFAEALYPRLATHPDVAWASPVVEVEAHRAGIADSAGTPEPALRLLGIDPLRAWRINPALLPAPAPGDNTAGLGLLEDDTVALTPAAAQAFGVRIGDRLHFVAGSGTVELRVIALLPGVGSGTRLAVADIATVQARFHYLGRLSRVDLVLAPQRPAAAALKHIAAGLPAGVAAVPVTATEARAERLSRAYRTNLSLLALMALVTGAFLVFTTQAASIVRRRAELAFLRAIGLRRREIVSGLLAEAAVVGVAGSLAGAALGVGLAALGLAALGGDLGAGFFAGTAPPLAISPPALLGQIGLGIAAALAGAWLPAREAAAAPPALALKAGDDERALSGLDRRKPGLLCLVLGLGCLTAPPVAGIALGAYAAIGLWLAGCVLLLPRVARRVFARLPAGRGAAGRLALAQLRGAPGLASIGIAGVVTATAVAAAMAIMVGSFRESLDRWLDVVLPAELYVRIAGAAGTGFLDPPLQLALTQLDGLARVDLIRHGNLVLDPALPSVALIARPLAGPPAALVGTVAAPPQGAHDGGTRRVAVWASEALADLYGWKAGDAVRLPLDGVLHEAYVAGFWRDYARSFGAVIIDLADYRRLTGDPRANDAALFVGDGGDVATVVDRLRRLPVAAGLEIVDSSEIRRRSLHIFDRTFAVTYALEAAAVLIGLAGVAASFAALAAARRREFGVLAHLGLSRRELTRLIGLEGAAGAGLGIGIGIALGFAIALVLIHIVNRQSFHWSMDLHVPWLGLTAFAATMLLGATLSALLAARSALGGAAINAVREDW